MVKARQEGITAIGALVILVLVGFLALAVLKLFPVYMEHFSVTASMESLKEEPGDERLTGRKLEQLLMRRFNVNSVQSVGREHIEVDPNDSGFTVSVVYERRVPFMANIDFVVSFDDTVEVAAR
ncbi:MAG TPA: DUF4845 domain-containing protein [Gammaproteobacteria bacterium]|nr:DUF4845 domain-containing protein [Gammaproteobacteria bacterium]